MTVAEMLNSISSTELSEWMAFYELEPFGCEIDMMAVIATQVYNSCHEKPLKPKDFMPNFETETKEQSIDEMIQAARMWSIVGGGDNVND